MANALAEVAKTKRISLCGIKPDQKEVDFSYQSLKAADAVLLAYDIKVNAPLTDLNLRSNNIGVEGAKAIAAALPLRLAASLRTWLVQTAFSVSCAKRAAWWL